MAQNRTVVLGEREATDRLPDWANGGAIMVEWLTQHGTLAAVMDRLKIQREGGYIGLDGFLLFLYYFGSGKKKGLKGFREDMGAYGRQCAALGGRKWMPSQAAVSRLLSAVQPKLVDEFTPWLLREAADIAEVLNHPSVFHRDAQGVKWTVLDWDPTVSVIRHRALPSTEDSPEGHRRSEETGEAGYLGRKRGDIQFSRCVLQHAGSGLWLYFDIDPGGHHLHPSFERAVEQSIKTCEYAGLSLCHTMIRADGAAGSVPFMTACTDAGLSFITRSAHYELLETDEVSRHLEEASWYPVESSKSGPMRYATELGQVWLEPARGSVREDGTPYTAILVRIVISRYLHDPKKKGGAGKQIGDWKYEVFATSLAEESWPEAEVVTAYFGRGGQENRYAQEDRELGLDRIFSYHLPGQQLAAAIGLFVWNFNICRAFELSVPSQDLPEQALSTAYPPKRLPAVYPPQSSVGGDVTDHDGQASTSPSTEGVMVVCDTGTPDRDPTATQLCTEQASSPRKTFLEALMSADWEQLLHHYPSWRWEQTAIGLACAGGHVIPFVRIEVRDGKACMRFIGPSGICEHCTKRKTCTKTTSRVFRKQMRLTLKEGNSAIIDAWNALPQRSRQFVLARRYSDDPDLHVRDAWLPSHGPVVRPLYAAVPPTLLPAVARKRLRTLAASTEIHVKITEPSKSKEPSDSMLAVSAARRQNRRLTWEERRVWNAISADTRIDIRILGSTSQLQNLISTGDADM